MRLIEARDRGVITPTQVNQYLLNGYTLSTEIGLDDQSPISPVAADIDFQSKRGVNVLSASLETDVAALSNIPVRVEKLDISSSGTFPILVTATKVALLYMVLDVSEEFVGTLSVGNSGDHSKYVSDEEFVKSVSDDPDIMLVGNIVLSGVTINAYSEITEGEGSLYLVYVKLA